MHRYREVQRSPARSETPCMYVNTLRGNREIPRPPKIVVGLVRIGKSNDTRQFVGCAAPGIARESCFRRVRHVP